MSRKELAMVFVIARAWMLFGSESPFSKEMIDGAKHIASQANDSPTRSEQAECVAYIKAEMARG